MSRDKKPLDPPVYVKNSQGEEIRVGVGPLSWLGVKELLDTISAVDLPLPSLATNSVSAWLKGQQGDLAAIEAALKAENDSNDLGNLLVISSQRQNLGLYQALVDLLSENVGVLYQWLLKHPPIVESLVCGATGLNRAQIETLSAGDFMRVARASLAALMDSGITEEISGFFGELLRRMLGGGAQAGSEASPSNAEAPSSAASASESKSASPD